VWVTRRDRRKRKGEI